MHALNITSSGDEENAGHGIFDIGEIRDLLQRVESFPVHDAGTNGPRGDQIEPRGRNGGTHVVKQASNPELGNVILSKRWDLNVAGDGALQNETSVFTRGI